MSKVKKAMLTVLVDAVMLAVLVFSVYSMLFCADTELMKNIYTALILISIPVIFFVTYMSIAGDKYDYIEDLEDEADTLSVESSENKEDSLGDEGFKNKEDTLSEESLENK